MRCHFGKFVNFCLLLVSFIALATSVAFASAEEDAHALQLEFDMPLVQGGMVTGHTSATSLFVLGRELELDESGSFVFGIGRDVQSLSVKLFAATDAAAESREFPVRSRDYNVQYIEGVDPKYVSPPEDVLRRIREEAALVAEARDQYSSAKAYQQRFIRPAQGPITGVYGSQRVLNGVAKQPHYGLDIAGPVGTAVIAPADGKVVLAHPDMYYSGGTLIIDHGRGISSTFIHLSKIYVEPGQSVEQGTRIADIGATGRVTGPHLDWRVNWFDQRLDPAFFLPPESAEP